MWRFVIASALLVSCASERAGSVEEQAEADDASSAVDDAATAGGEADASAAEHDSGEHASAANDAGGAHESASEAQTPAATDAGPAPHDAGEPQPSLDGLLAVYRSWMPYEAEPQAISAQIASLCRIPTAAEESFAASEHGDYLLLQNWLNDSARQAFASKQTPFPVGAAIVKEKLGNSAAFDYVLVARGVMVKREAGFDPAHNDWQFGYWTPSAGLTADQATADHCGACHAGAKTDFVFLDRSWRFDRDAGW